MSRYDDFASVLKAAHLTLEPSEIAGLAAGLIARGVRAGDRAIAGQIRALLLDGEMMPGTLTAAVTALSIDLEEALKSGTGLAEILLLPPRGSAAAARLQALSELAHGLMLGLTLGPKTAGPEDPGLKELLLNLREITQVDAAGDLAEDDFSTILDYLAGELHRLHAQSL